MAMNAFGRYGGNSFSDSTAPPASPRVTSTREFTSTIRIEGGRLGISSDWMAGRCAPIQATAPTPPITVQSASTSIQ